MAYDSESRPKPKRRLTDLRLRAIYYENPSGDRVLLYDAVAAAAARERDAALWARGLRDLERSTRATAASTKALKAAAARRRKQWAAEDAKLRRTQPRWSRTHRAQKIAETCGVARWRTGYDFLRAALK